MTASKIGATTRPRAQTERLVLALVMVAAVAVLAYVRDLDGSFRAPDSLALIKTAQLNGPGDLSRIFSEPLMADIGLSSVHDYFRPVTTLSYGVDEMFWGLNPVGYVLTNVFVFAVAASITAATTFSLLRSVPAASIAGLLVAVHPVAVEAVPSAARRHDLLAALFVVAAIGLFASAHHRRARGLLSASVVALVLALLSKESAFVALLPLAVLAYRQQPLAGSPARRARATLRDLLPYGAAAAVVLLWRSLVVAGNHHADTGELVSGAGTAIERAAVVLVYPMPVITQGERRMDAVAIAIFGLVLLACGTLIASAPEPQRGRATTCALVGASWLLGLLTLLVASGELTTRSFYPAGTAFALIIAGGAAAAFSAGFTPLRVGAGAVLVGVSALVLAASPLVRDYPQWQRADQAAEQVLAVVDAAVLQCDTATEMHLSAMPKRVRNPVPRAFSPRNRQASVMRGYSIESYVSMKYPGREVHVPRTPGMTITEGNEIQADFVCNGDVIEVEVSQVPTDA